MRTLALYAIRFYQRRLSPLKGFVCAYRAHTGRQSCSQLGYRAIRRYGVIGGTGVLKLRLDCCRDEYRKHHVPLQPRRMRELQQGGFCDASCDLPCDASGAEGLLDVCNCLDCGNLDFPTRQKSKRETNT